MKTCVSCGTSVSNQDGEEYPYCERCNQERHDPTIRPKVWEYIGGVIGSQPNRRGSLEYTLQDDGFSPHSIRDGIQIFTREDDGSPNGLVAFITQDNCIVIVGGGFELDGMWNRWISNPILTNLPKRIESLFPEHHDLVEKIQREAGLHSGANHEPTTD